MSGFIERSEWKNFLDEFSKRNQLRPTHLEVIGEVGAQEAEVFLPFVGVDFESKGSMKGSVEIALGGKTAADERQLTHLVTNVEHIAPIVGVNGVEDGLGIEDRDGVKTLLRFETLPEIEDGKSALRGRRVQFH